jgi:hypothetical protein
MDPRERTTEPLPSNPWTATDIESILHEHGWLVGNPSPEQLAWCDRAATLLGPQAEDRGSLEGLLRLVFHYDAATLITQVESQMALSRYAARDVLREAGRVLLESGELDSDRFKQLVASLREKLQLSAREILVPIRLTLAGQLGEGELDRVILLLDPAAALHWAVRVKSARVRIVEFFASLD